MSSQRKIRPVSKTLREYARGAVGGLLFSLPLLYTMEVWWAGLSLEPARLLAYMAVTFALLMGYNRFAGMRHESRWSEVLIECVEEMGIGLMVSALILAITERITLEMTTTEVVGRIVVEAMIVAIGASVGTTQLGEHTDQGKSAGRKPLRKGIRFESQLVVALCGAVLFSANVAPTDEVEILAIETSAISLLWLMLLSIVATMAILYYSDFKGAEELAPINGPFSVIFGSIVTYAIALATAAGTLFFMDRFAGSGVSTTLAMIVVLGFPAALGASAGRLLLR